MKPWPRPLYVEAEGAAALLAASPRAGVQGTLPRSADALLRPARRRFATLPLPGDQADRVERLAARPVPRGAVRRPAVLGLDLGSTGSKAALVSLDDGEIVLDVYDRTRGNPVDAARRLVAEVLRCAAPDVRAIALTGSGREAAAAVARAALGDDADRMVVENEIVAHATSAICCDPAGGESLSVVEIGGQDAKFIQIADGQITESDMNRACSAGTGSFLEEQAQLYDVARIEEFSERAAAATRIPDLGQMCTVHVAEAAAEAQHQGFGRADLFGGFCYSVVHNYLHRVMGQRRFGERIFFQGKPASGDPLAWTLAAVTGRRVTVPANPGAMGAWGIGLVARQRLDGLPDAQPIDLNALLGARVVEHGELRCRDKDCATLCTIDRTVVEVGERTETVLSGGACPRYEVDRSGLRRLPRDAPSAVDERSALLAPFLEPWDGERTVGVPLVGACFGVLPFLVTFVRELGLGGVVLRSDRGSLARGEARCQSFDACAPVKIAHGVLDGAPAGLDSVLLPKLLTLADRDGPGGRTCPMEQALPEMLRGALEATGRALPVVSPVLSLTGPSWALLRPLTHAARELGASAASVPMALRAALAAQGEFEEALADIGRRTLDYGARHGVPVVALCGTPHVVHDPAVNAGIPRLLRDNGALALPADAYPLPGDADPMERLSWADARRALQVARCARERGDAFPLMLTAFGCGPSSFGEQVFDALCQGYPHTCLESDGHGGAAGYVTRVQAFLHAVREQGRVSSPPPARTAGLLLPPRVPSLEEERDSRLVLFAASDRASGVLAAAYRAYGFDAVSAGPTDATSFAAGRGDCSGKECLPYQTIWGAFRQYLERDDGKRRTLLVQLPGQGMCRNCMFSLKDQLTLGHLGLEDHVDSRHLDMEPELGWPFLLRFWVGAVAWDLLFQLASYLRPRSRGDRVDDLYDRYCGTLEELIGRPGRRGARGLADALAVQERVARMLRYAAVEFAAAVDPPNGERSVLLSGDIYLRIDPFASDELVRRLNRRGLAVLIEPASALVEYMARERLGELFGLPSQGIDHAAARAGMEPIRRRLYGAVRRMHPWLPVPDGAEVVRQAARVLDRYPQGEAPVTVGSVLHHWEQRLCDGAVVVAPWGCGPSLVAESLLRHQREIPLLFVYADGTPLDTRRLDAYAFRLRRQPARTDLARPARIRPPAPAVAAGSPRTPRA